MNSEKLWNKSYLLLMLAQVLTSFSFYMVVTILVSYLTSDAVGISTSAAGVVAGLFSVTALFCRPFCGVLSDKVNKLALIRTAVILMGVGTLGYGLSDSLAVIIFFRILNGAGFAVNSTALIALVTQYIPRNRMGEGIGYFGLANVIASAAGPGLGAALAEWIGTDRVFYLSAAICLFELILLFMVSFDEEHGREKKQGKRLQLEDIIAVPVLGYTVTASAFSLVNGVISAYLVAYGEALGIGGISLYYTANAITLFLVRPMSGKLMDRKGAAIVVMPGILITALSMLFLEAAGSFREAVLGMILLSAVLRGIGQGAAHPALQTVCLRKAGKEKSGSATSTFYLGGDIGQGMGPMLAGAMIGAFSSALDGYRAVFRMSAWLLVGAFVLFAVLWKKEKTDEERTELYVEKG